MHFLNAIRFIARSIRWGAVIQSTASSGHVHLSGDNIVPDTSQVLHQLLFTRLRIHICHTCIQVIGTYGMSHCTILVTERDTVLIIIRTTFYHTANVNQVFWKFQITGISCSTIHLHHSHIVWRANSIACQLGRSRLIEVTKEICSFHGSIKKSRFSGSTVVNDTCHHQVSQVIRFKIQPIGKCTFFVLRAYFRTNHCLLLGISQRMAVYSLIQFFYNNRRMYITICTLGFYDTSNKVVH